MYLHVRKRRVHYLRRACIVNVDAAPSGRGREHCFLLKPMGMRLLPTPLLSRHILSHRSRLCLPAPTCGTAPMFLFAHALEFPLALSFFVFFSCPARLFCFYFFSFALFVGLGCDLDCPPGPFLFLWSFFSPLSVHFFSLGLRFLRPTYLMFIGFFPRHSFLCSFSTFCFCASRHGFVLSVSSMIDGCPSCCPLVTSAYLFSLPLIASRFRSWGVQPHDLNLVPVYVSFARTKNSVLRDSLSHSVQLCHSSMSIYA